MLEMTPRKQTPTPHDAPAVTDVEWVVRLDEPAALNADRMTIVKYHAHSLPKLHLTCFATRGSLFLQTFKD